MLNGVESSLASTLEASYRYGSTMFHQSFERSQPLQTYLLGYPIKASLAPTLHNTLFKQCQLPWKYSLLESKVANDLMQLLPEPSTIGAAVTMPHKISFANDLKLLTPEAAITGAVNTIFSRCSPQGQRLFIGTNTDTIGVREAFLRNLTKEQQVLGAERPAMIIGGGGAARAAIYALHQWLGVSKIYLVNRLAQEVDDIKRDFESSPGWTAEFVHITDVGTLTSLPSPFLVVSTIPDYPAVTAAEANVKALSTAFMSSSEKGLVLEMCYMPHVKTSFYRLAEEQGWKVISGIEAMIWQGVAQQILWTETMDPARTEAVAAAESFVRESISKVQGGL